MKIKSNAKVVFYLVYNEELFNELIENHRWKTVKIEPDCMAVEIPPNELETLCEGLTGEVVVIKMAMEPFKVAMTWAIEAQKEIEKRAEQARLEEERRKNSLWGKLKVVFG